MNEPAGNAPYSPKDQEPMSSSTNSSSPPSEWSGRDARYDGATDEQVAETILADLNYRRLPYERALIVTAAHVQGIRAAERRAADSDAP